METTAAITLFHRNFAKAIDSGMRAQVKMHETVLALVKGRYAETMPVYAEYDADQQAFALLAKERKLVDNQYYRKLYAGIITEVYGALPVSLDDAASKKRTQRINAAPSHVQAAYHAAEAEAKKAGKQAHEVVALAMKASQQAKAPKKQDNLGAPKDTPKPQAPTMAEGLEQLVARVGPCEVLEAVNRILAGDKATKLQAATLAAVITQLRKALQPGKA